MRKEARTTKSIPTGSDADKQEMDNYRKYFINALKDNYPTSFEIVIAITD